MKRFSVIFLLVFVFGFSGIGAEINITWGKNHFIKKWRKNAKIKCNKVAFLVDFGVSNEKLILTKLAEETEKELMKKGINAKTIYSINEAETYTLVIKLTSKKSRKTVLALFKKEIPICWQIEVNQQNLFVEPYRRNINSRISISQESKQVGLKEAAIDFSERIGNSIKRIK